MPELLPYAPGSPAWLAARRTGVTATDIVNILGIGSKSAYWVFWNKMGQVPDDPDNDRFRLGRYLEHYAVHRWLEDHPGWVDEPSSLLRSSARAWQMATLDRLVHPRGESDEVPLEVKTWADADKPAWGPSFAGGTEVPPASNVQSWQMDVVTAPAVAGSPKDGAQPGPTTPKIPPAVRAQVLWQMDTMDVAAGHVGVVFLPSGEFRSYTIEHEPTYAGSGWGCNGDTCSLCADLILMRAAGDEFMQRLRLELPAPDPDASAATLAAVKARFAKAPDKQAEVDGDVFETWLQTKNVIAEYEYDQRALEIRLREQAGEASILTVDGQPVARRITGEAQVKAHTRRSDYLKRIVREPVTDEPTNGIGE